MDRRTFLMSATGCTLFLTGCTTNSPTNEGANTPSAETSTAQKNPTEATSTVQPETTSLKTVSNRPGPNLISGLNSTKYNTVEQTQKTVSFDLPTVELPDGYIFSRAYIAGSSSTTNVDSSDTTNTTKEFVALIYANRSNNSTVEWAVVEISHPQTKKLPTKVGRNISIGNRTGVYYREKKRSNLIFICGSSMYDLRGPFTRKQLIEIVQSICKGK